VHLKIKKADEICLLSPFIMSGLLLGWGVDADLESCPVFSLELHDTVNKRKERVIRALLDIAARMKLGPPLPDEDIACLDKLAPEPLYAETLGLTIASVS